MPGQFRAVNSHLVAIARDDGELAGKVFLVDGGLDGVLRDSGGGHWFQNQPAADEAGGIGRGFAGAGSRQEVGWTGASNAGDGVIAASGQRQKRGAEQEGGHEGGSITKGSHKKIL